MFLYGENVDVVYLAASNNLLVSLTSCVGQGPNVLCGEIESLVDLWCSSVGSLIRDMASDFSILTMLRHDEIAL